MKSLLAFLFFACIAIKAYSDTWNMFNRRVGMFIHWGAYFVGGYHEQEWMKPGLIKTGIDLHPRKALPEEAVLLNTNTKLKSEIVTLTYRNELSLHIYDIPINDFLDEPPIIRLKFPPN